MYYDSTTILSSLSNLRIQTFWIPKHARCNCQRRAFVSWLSNWSSDSNWIALDLNASSIASIRTVNRAHPSLPRSLLLLVCSHRLTLIHLCSMAHTLLLSLSFICSHLPFADTLFLSQSPSPSRSLRKMNSSGLPDLAANCRWSLYRLQFRGRRCFSFVPAFGVFGVLRWLQYPRTLKIPTQ